MSTHFPDTDYKSIRKLLRKQQDGGAELLFSLLKQDTSEDELVTALNDHLDMIQKLRDAILMKAADEAARAIVRDADFEAAEEIFDKAKEADRMTVGHAIKSLTVLNKKTASKIDDLARAHKEDTDMPIGLPQLYHLF